MIKLLLRIIFALILAISFLLPINAQDESISSGKGKPLQPSPDLITEISTSIACEETTKEIDTSEGPEISTTTNEDSTEKDTTLQPEDSTTEENETEVPTTLEPEESTTKEIEGGTSTTLEPAESSTQEDKTTENPATEESTTEENETEAPTTDTDITTTSSTTEGLNTTETDKITEITNSTLPSVDGSSTSSTSGLETTLSPPTTESPFSCGSGADYLPHPTDCQQFIQCSNGIEYNMECPTGLYWNYIELHCGTDDSRCYAGGNNTNPDNEICRGATGGYIPNQFDCTKYYQCNHGHPISQKCPDPLFWNANKLVCDWSSDTCSAPPTNSPNHK